MSEEKSIPLSEVPGIQPIQPARFIWHVSKPENRAMIHQLGLRSDFSEHLCIFANNQSELLGWFYPFCLDHYRGVETEDLAFEDWDFWCIDTSLFEASWYVDPLMAVGKDRMSPEDWYYFAGHESHFVCAEVCIPPTALTLFHYYPSAQGLDAIFGRSEINSVASQLDLRPLPPSGTLTLPDSPDFRAA